MILRTLARVLYPFAYGFAALTALMELLTDGIADVVDDSLSEWWGQAFWLSLPPLIAGGEFGFEAGIMVAGLVVIALQTYAIGRLRSE